ncbi:MAG TPA: prephenate dehydrogenase/arogenate dehydrogenase family protein [Thiotrichales bacterium]|nr:prephenate dehydrogenase/arogenate dehydrogenase family protein [Thiotrichales bacterium]
MSGVLFSRVCIVGVGLIGGSLARAARERGLIGEVVGCSRNAGHLQRAVELGVIDRYSTDLAEAVSGADLVVIATPLGAIRRVLEGIAGHLAEGALITDVGSAKGSVVRDAREVFGGLPPIFVPGHPIAGTENSGVEASFPELFRERRVILTPVEETDPAATARVRALWEGVGAEVVEMSVEHHDEVLAATSHLPHVVAFSLVDTLARLNDRVEIFRYAAGGFRDFTRIASSDPVMWRDICLANREALLKILDDFRADLDRVRSAIERGDGEWLRDTFAAAKRARDDYSA